MSHNNRLSTGRPDDMVRTKLSDLIAARPERAAKPLLLGQVIDSKDPKNGNRLRIRIPLLDDIFYTDDAGQVKDDIGDDKLPWCVSANSRFVDTPENGSVVLVLLLDPEKPFTGRIWLTALTEMNVKDIFSAERQIEESTGNDGWKNAEDSVQVKYNNTPGLRGRNTLKSKTKKVNYPVGIRGKNKNKIVLDENKTSLIQGEGTNKEAKLELAEEANLIAQKLNLLSSQSSQEHEPVFASPLFQYLQQELNLLQSIIKILTTSPGVVGQVPVSPSPTAATLAAGYAQLANKLTQLKQNGSSRYIKIN